MAEALGVKRKCGQVLKSKEHHVVLNEFSCMETRNPEQIVRLVTDETAI
jgi:hypothetical protein